MNTGLNLRVVKGGYFFSLAEKLLASYEKPFCGFSQPRHHTLSRASHDTRSWVNVETHFLAITLRVSLKYWQKYGSDRSFSIVMNDAILFSAEELNVTQNKQIEAHTYFMSITCSDSMLTLW